MKSIVIMTHDMHGGGCERVISQLSNWLVENEIKCTIITEIEAPPFYHINEKIDLYSLTNQKKFKSKDIIKSYLKFRNRMKEIKPDIVLSMPEKVNVWTAVAMVGLRIPLVVSERNNPAIYPPSKVKRIIRKLIYPYVNGFIFQTEDASEFFSRSIRKRSAILPNPLDLNRVPNTWKGERRKEIVSIGRLEKQKNHYLLIDAFSEFQKTHKDYFLTIYGEGSLRDDIESYAKQKLSSNTYALPGKKSNVLELINDASIFVLSSDYEGMPNALIEAMALGLPVISTNCPTGGPKAIINNGSNGLLVPVGDKKALCEAMSILANDKIKAENIGSHAIEIKKELDIEVLAPKWLLYLEEIIKNSK